MLFEFVHILQMLTNGIYIQIPEEFIRACGLRDFVECGNTDPKVYGLDESEELAHDLADYLVECLAESGHGLAWPVEDKSVIWTVFVPIWNSLMICRCDCDHLMVANSKGKYPIVESIIEDAEFS